MDSVTDTLERKLSIPDDVKLSGATDDFFLWTATSVKSLRQLLGSEKSVFFWSESFPVGAVFRGLGGGGGGFDPCPISVYQGKKQ